jgi:hypothetical protein
MAEENDIINKDTTEKIETSDNKITFVSILNGSFLTGKFFSKQLKFILFLSLLSILYISNRNSAERTLNNITELQREVREIRSESITIASELMFASKQSEVYKLVKEKELGLVEATEPPKKLKISAGD